MINTIEKSAKTKDEAIELALKELGITIEEAEIEVVEEGSKGFLGLGGKDATVKVSFKDSCEKRA
ncbi:MAG: Jag N-terminal domain-containing protein, partial [Selenomonadaceae bacterium]|nr:Jag N-terminal domain-containing protein [Selenomonadaceae bacterium]